jgi:hypothetical protein
MDTRQRSLQELQQIKQMMERSSKFISLSGLSGIAAGICALTGAWFAGVKIALYKNEHGVTLNSDSGPYVFKNGSNDLIAELLIIALITFVTAFISAFLFTWLRSKKTGAPLWGTTTLRLFWNTSIPMAAGGLFLLRSLQLNDYSLVAPGCLIFYGLALVNASKYTLGEIRYLGYAQIILGVVNLWFIGYGLYFWAAGFGLMHIIYGMLMWYKYERDGFKLEEE